MLAAVALRAGAVEIGVDALAALPEVDRLRLDAGEGVPRAQGFGGALQQMVLQAARRVGARAQHALGLGVVRRQRLLPAGLGLRPGRRRECGRRRAQQHPGEHLAATAHRHAAHHGHVAKHPLREVAAQPQIRRPHQLAQPLGAGLDVGGLQAATTLKHRHAVALLGHAQRTHRATKAAADDDAVELANVGGRHGQRDADCGGLKRNGKCRCRNSGSSRCIRPSQQPSASGRSSSIVQRHGTPAVGG